MSSTDALFRCHSGWVKNSNSDEPTNVTIKPDSLDATQRDAWMLVRQVNIRVRSALLMDWPQKRTLTSPTGYSTHLAHTSVFLPAIMSDHFCAKCVEVCLCGLKSLVYFTFSCASPASCHSLYKHTGRTTNSSLQPPGWIYRVVRPAGWTSKGRGCCLRRPYPTPSWRSLTLPVTPTNKDLMWICYAFHLLY